ncbi:glycosyltransferase family 4 protein [Patescibacteria group bacterium]|nr:glycosyltransferase family 4 protein [Patescibacteria group bacterium]
MNILILNWRDPKNPKSGGAEIVTMEHAKTWVKKGHSVTWFSSEFESSKKEEKIEDVNIVRRGNFLTVIFYAFIYYLFTKNKFDLVIDEIHGLPFFTPIYVKKPKIAFIHEVAEEIWDYMFPFPINRIGRALEPLYFKLYKNTKFWTDAESTIDDLEKYGIKRKNCIAINCPVENKPLKTIPRKESTPTFIFVSRVVKMKGIEEVIRAFFYILRELKDSKLWIVGDGEESYVNELKDTMKAYSISPKVKFFGQVSNDKKLELMKKAHILLHASVKEGWGLVIIEAASMATPSVVYNVSGLKDSVKNGKTGIVLEENSAKEMAKQAVALIKNKNKYLEFQKNGLKWAESLTWVKATKQSLDLLNEIVKN